MGWATKYPNVQTENFVTFETTSPNFSCFADSRPKGHVTRFARRACWGMCQSCRSRSKDGHICTCCACHRDSCLSRWLPCYCPWIANIMQNQRLQPINLSSKTMINLYILLECAIDDERRISEQIGTTVRCFSTVHLVACFRWIPRTLWVWNHRFWFKTSLSTLSLPCWICCM